MSINPNSRRQIFVVAGNHSEFSDLIKRKKAEFLCEPHMSEDIFPYIFPDYVYVSNVDILRGRSEIEGFYYGTYWSRPDLIDIQYVIDTIKDRMRKRK